jgi:hypothetical protein
MTLVHSAKGSAVSYYLRGENMITAAPQGFYKVDFGTSMSAPLLIRSIIHHLPNSLLSSAVISALDAQMNEERVIAEDLPASLFFDNKGPELFW